MLPVARSSLPGGQLQLEEPETLLGEEEVSTQLPFQTETEKQRSNRPVVRCQTMCRVRLRHIVLKQAVTFVVVARCASFGLRSSSMCIWSNGLVSLLLEWPIILRGQVRDHVLGSPVAVFAVGQVKARQEWTLELAQYGLIKTGCVRYPGHVEVLDDDRLVVSAPVSRIVRATRARRATSSQSASCAVDSGLGPRTIRWMLLRPGADAVAHSDSDSRSCLVAGRPLSRVIQHPGRRGKDWEKTVRPRRC